jgi:hypothetical protein
MKKMMLVLACLWAGNTLAAPVAAVMTYESSVLTTEGVKKHSWFQEQFIRDGNQVWSQRIISAQAPKHAEHEHEEHDHNLNFATAGKWLSRDKDGQILFKFVRTDEKKIIAPRFTEYGALGFDGEWETAYYLVNRASLKTMTKLNQPAPTGAVWYEKRNAHEFARILWDEKNQLPLSIENGTLDGNQLDKISLKIVPTPRQMPWEQLGGYETIAYEDLLD